jgi:hypothetical protein
MRKGSTSRSAFDWHLAFQISVLYELRNLAMYRMILSVLPLHLHEVMPSASPNDLIMERHSTGEKEYMNPLWELAKSIGRHSEGEQSS